MGTLRSALVQTYAAWLARALGEPAAAAGERLAPAHWYTASSAPAPAVAAELLREMADREVVLLGERHDRADDHRWQLQTLAALHLLRPRMVIGFEAFPRRVQPVLDRWVAGELGESSFLAEVGWNRIWNMAPALYLPLFEFARLNRIPIAALNVDRDLVRSVAREGWDALDPARREGVSRPAAANPAYRDRLFEVFGHHAARAGGERAERAGPRFARFVESQLVWDRAMAEALAAHLRAPPARPPLVVGLAGEGHLRHGHGIAHQLRSLGVTRIGTLLPVTPSDGDARLEPGLADAVFVLPEQPAAGPPRARLGVTVEEREGSVIISQVVQGSLAESSGLRVGDRVAEVAGTPVLHSGQFTEAVHAQPAGTWMPTRVHRAGAPLDLVVRFPPEP